MDFTDKQIQIYSNLGCDYITTIRSLRRKMQSTYKKVCELYEKFSNDTLTTIDRTVTFAVPDRKVVTTGDLYDAINSGAPRVRVYDDNGTANYMDLSSVSNYIGQQNANAQAALCSIETLEEMSFSDSDPILIFNDKLNDAGLNKDAVNVNIFSNIKSILSDNTSQIYTKFGSILGALTFDVDQQGTYTPVQGVFSSANPTLLLLGGIQLDMVYNDLCTTASTVVAKFLVVYHKVWFKAFTSMSRKISLWFDKSFSSGQRVKIINDNGYGIADFLPNYLTGPCRYSYGSCAMESWAVDNGLVDNGYLCIAGIGGYYFIQFFYDEDDLDTPFHYKAYLCPIANDFSNFIARAQIGSASSAINSFNEMFDCLTTYTNVPDSKDYSPLSTNWDDASQANESVSKCFHVNSWLLLQFLRVYHRNPQNWHTEVFTSADVEAWSQWMYNDTSHNPYNASGNNVAQPYLSSGYYPTIDQGGLNDLLDYVSEMHFDDEFNIPYYPSQSWITPTYHLADATELTEAAGVAAIKIAVGIVLIIGAIALGKVIKNVRANVLLKQAQIDQALFDPNLTIDDAKQLLTQQKKVNLLNKVFGFAESESSSIANSVLGFQSQSSDELSTNLTSIINLIK